MSGTHEVFVRCEQIGEKVGSEEKIRLEMRAFLTMLKS